MNMDKVIVLGDIILDMIAHIPRYPPPGGDGIARNVLIKSGGSAANTARALAQSGIDTGVSSPPYSVPQSERRFCLVLRATNTLEPEYPLAQSPTNWIG